MDKSPDEKLADSEVVSPLIPDELNLALHKDEILSIASTTLLRCREVILNELRKNPMSLEYLDKELKNDRTFVLAAVTENGEALEFASERLRNDREVVIAAMSGCIKDNHVNALNYLGGKLENDRYIFLASIYIQEPLLKNLFSSLLSNEKADSQSILSLVDYTCTEMIGISEKHKDDKEIIFAVLTTGGNVLASIASFPKKFRDIIRDLLRNVLSSLEGLSEDMEFMLNAIEATHAVALSCLTKELKDNYCFMINAIELTHGLALNYIGEDLKGNKTFIMDAMGLTNGWAYKHADDRLKEDPGLKSLYEDLLI